MSNMDDSTKRSLESALARLEDIIDIPIDHRVAIAMSAARLSIKKALEEK